MSIKVYNTLTRKKEPLAPREEGKISVYICGPTVYNYIHIGNARCYISFDAIIRYLSHRGFEVTYTRNITDVDDKIINRARQEKTTEEEIASKYTQAFSEDMKALGEKPPDISPKATEHISEMIEVVKRLVDGGYAYAVDGDVFFDVTTFGDYGKLSRRSLEEMRAGERVEVDPRKHHPLDFALWKKAKQGEPSWPSSWGEGRPGWHIECSTMSCKYLGMGFDIHGGGQDLIFPHHENEIAQAESCAGAKPFARYWLHNGFVNVNQEKMAKSVGNIVLVRDLRNAYKDKPGLLKNALRMLFLSTHYRSPIDYSEDRLKEAESKYLRLERLRLRLNHFAAEADFSAEASPVDEQKEFEQGLKKARKGFYSAMDDDFNTAGALAAVFDLAEVTNIFLDGAEQRKSLPQRCKQLLDQGWGIIEDLSTKVLGLDFGHLQETRAGSLEEFLKIVEDFASYLLVGRLGEELQKAGESKDINSLVECAIKLREEARKASDWEKADEIRHRLAELGVVIEDAPRGSRWRWGK